MSTHDVLANCRDCGRNAENVANIGGRIVCEDCSAHCEHCDELDRVDTMDRVHTTESHWDSALYCSCCYSDHTWACEDCGSVFADSVRQWSHEDRYGALCRVCYASAVDAAREREERVIGGYHSAERRAATMPVASEWTRRHGNRFIGVELEVERHADSSDELHEIARTMLDVANVSDMRRMFAEHDGSLNYGFELITQPMGLDAHRELWPRVLATSAVRELRSHDTTTCGLHVHVSRTGLSRLQIAKAVVFLNDPRNEPFIRAIARRYGNSYCKIKHVRMGVAAFSHDRYEMLNLTPTRTVEFRLFRGTLRASTVLACVEFAHALLEWARNAACNALTWQAFVAWCYAPAQRDDTANLRAYLARRVTERMAPRYAELRALITDVTGKEPVNPTNNTDAVARWAEI
jgi:hypothetical protein